MACPLTAESYEWQPVAPALSYLVLGCSVSGSESAPCLPYNCVPASCEFAGFAPSSYSDQDVLTASCPFSRGWLPSRGRGSVRIRGRNAAEFSC